MKPLQFDNNSSTSQTGHLHQHASYHPIVSLLISLTITTVTILIIGFFYLFFTFSIEGGQPLNEIENQHIQQFYISVLILAIAFLVAKFYLRKGKKYTALGILVLPILLVLSTSNYLLKNNFNHTPFSKTLWMQSLYKPEKMAKTLVREKKLIGLTRTQIKDMLGKGSKEYGDIGTGKSEIEYLVLNDWTMTVFFLKDKVIASELRLPYHHFW
ncbi:hypothetical protein [Flavobacterium foetidum]|uniref:hypothetical protein n=1 Tax=Flavobacterium foetidum TaxID=2026681 RepID=UPI001074C122|nr:hypothetical protein [Flavobacterium foetidum]KAF2509107.1 hypothetical protein E0W73_19045 [Flavobacterium foetidum]